MSKDTNINPKSKKDSYFDFGRWKNKKQAGLLFNALLVVILLAAVFISNDPFNQNQIAPEEEQTQTALNPQEERAPLPEAEQPQSDKQVPPSDTTGNQNTATASQQNGEEATTDAVLVEGEPKIWLPPANATWDRNYGYCLDPTFQDYRFHKGCDMTLEIGQPVLATAQGTVKSIACDPLWGDVVTLSHGGGFESVYMGITAAQLTVGQPIAAGDLLGTVSASPKAEQAQKPHLHFELYLNGVSQDPLTWLSQ